VAASAVSADRVGVGASVDARDVQGVADVHADLSFLLALVVLLSWIVALTGCYSSAAMLLRGFARPRGNQAHGSGLRQQFAWRLDFRRLPAFMRGTNEDPGFCHSRVKSRWQKPGPLFEDTLGPDKRREQRTRLATENPYSGVEWEKLWKKLRVYAIALTKSAMAVFDCGISAEDLVSETLAEFFSDPGHLGWTPKKGRLETFLGTVLRNKFIDHVRRDKHVAGSFDDQDFLQGQGLPSRTTGREEDQEASTFADLLRARVKGEKDLEDLITAAELIEGGHNVNQQLAEILSVDTDEVVNRKKRLLRIRGIKELYEQRRKSQEAS